MIQGAGRGSIAAPRGGDRTQQCCQKRCPSVWPCSPEGSSQSSRKAASGSLPPSRSHVRVSALGHSKLSTRSPEGLSQAAPLFLPATPRPHWMWQCGAPLCGQERPCSRAIRIPGCPPLLINAAGFQEPRPHCPRDVKAVAPPTSTIPTGLPPSYIPSFLCLLMFSHSYFKIQCFFFNSIFYACQEYVLVFQPYVTSYPKM